MIKTINFFDNPNIKEIAKIDHVRVLEFEKDLSVTRESAISAFYASEMNVRKRQVVVELNGNAFVISAGAMNWTAGQVQMTSDIKGIGDFLGKAIGGAVTKESAAKPLYKGHGLLVLEPTYKHILLERVEEWGTMVLDDGLFLGCDDSIKRKVVARTNLSSAVLGGEGLFNIGLQGNGIAVLESPVPREELITVELDNDELRIDGNFAIAWSGTLDFRVEKSSKSLVGSAVSGEGFVNVYRGTGKVLLAPVG